LFRVHGGNAEAIALAAKEASQCKKGWKKQFKRGFKFCEGKQKESKTSDLNDELLDKYAQGNQLLVANGFTNPKKNIKLL